MTSGLESVGAYAPRIATAATSAVTFAAELGVRLAVAESLTGGLVADALVSVPGSSHAFSGAIVAYDTCLKASLLGVDEQLLETHGPVHSEVAKQMARGVRQACAVPLSAGEDSVRAGLGVATTGVAGPDPDPQTGQAAGTVWVGVSSVRGERAVKLDLGGSRDEIRMATVAAALEELLEELRLISNP